MIIGSFDNNGLNQSYPNIPPGYSEPQLLYNFHYEGFITQMSKTNNFIWSIDPPFYIYSGQGTSGITLQLMPTTSKYCSTLNYSTISLTISGTGQIRGQWHENEIIYYKHGAKWEISGNTFPTIKLSSGTTIKTVETYELIPQYDQSSYPPNCSTLPDSYSFSIKNGEIVKFYGNIPPYGNPLIDVFWYRTGKTYLSFYSSWANETCKFPTTLDIFVSTSTYKEPIEQIILTGTTQSMWTTQERPILLNSNIYFPKSQKPEITYTEYILEKNIKEINYTNLPSSWQISGNTTPSIQMQFGKFLQNTEAYTLIPSYTTLINTTTPDKFIIFANKGKIVNIYRNVNPILEIQWYQTGSTYISFYTKNENEIVNYPTTLDIYISTEEITPISPVRITGTTQNLWTHRQRPAFVHSSRKR